MGEPVILTEAKDYIGIITLNRPEAYNTFTPEFAESLNRALLDFDADDDIRVVVIRARGKSFSTGIDLAEFGAVDGAAWDVFIAGMDRHNHTIAGMKKPVISSVQGYCLANGAGLSFACDLTVAAETAKFGTTAINVGLICTGPGIPLIANVGRKKAMELVLLGEVISARQAQELGLVNWVTSDEELESKTMEIAEKIARKSPLAIAAGKRGLSAAYDATYSASVDLGTKRFAELCATRDAKEGIAAFLEKREPHWTLQ